MTRALIGETRNNFLANQSAIEVARIIVKSKKMLELLCRAAIVALTVFAGIILPFIPLGRAGQVVNLVWGTVYGLGWYLGGLIVGSIRLMPAMIFGVIIWPIIMAGVVYWACGLVFHSSARSQVIVASIAAISFLCVVNEERAFQPPFNGLPTFTHLFFIDY
jgi:hypothetical protein